MLAKNISDELELFCDETGITKTMADAITGNVVRYSYKLPGTCNGVRVNTDIATHQRKALTGWSGLLLYSYIPMFFETIVSSIANDDMIHQRYAYQISCFG